MFQNARVFLLLAHSSFVFVGIYLVNRQTRVGHDMSRPYVTCFDRQLVPSLTYRLR